MPRKPNKEKSATVRVFATDWLLINRSKRLTETFAEALHRLLREVP